MLFSAVFGSDNNRITDFFGFFYFANKKLLNKNQEQFFFFSGLVVECFLEKIFLNLYLETFPGYQKRLYFEIFLLFYVLVSKNKYLCLKLR